MQTESTTKKNGVSIVREERTIDGYQGAEGEEIGCRNLRKFARNVSDEGGNVATRH